MPELCLGDADQTAWMAEVGQVWSARGRSCRGPLVEQERKALDLGRGLHADPGVRPQTVWRQKHRPCPAAR